MISALSVATITTITVLQLHVLAKSLAFVGLYLVISFKLAGFVFAATNYFANSEAGTMVPAIVVYWLTAFTFVIEKLVTTTKAKQQIGDCSFG